MSNAASTPEFKKILKDIYDSGQAQNSGDALRMAWAEYRQKHHGGVVTVQQRRYVERKSFENPKREDRFGVFVWRGDGQYSKSDSLKNFYSEKLAQKFSDKYPEKNLVVRILRLISRNPKEMRPRIQVSKRQRRGKLRKRSPLKGFKINAQKRLCGSYVDSKTGEPCRLPYDICLHQRTVKGITAYKKFHEKKKLKNPIAIYNPIAIGTRVRTSRGLGIVEDYDQKSNQYYVRLAIGASLWFKNVKPDLRIAGKIPTYKQTLLKKNPIAIYNRPLKINNPIVRDLSRNLPLKGVKLPAKNIEIRYQRSGGRYAGQWFKHPFKGSVSLIGLPNGSVLIKSNSGKRLWGSV